MGSVLGLARVMRESFSIGPLHVTKRYCHRLDILKHPALNRCRVEKIKLKVTTKIQIEPRLCERIYSDAKT